MYVEELTNAYSSRCGIYPIQHTRLQLMVLLALQLTLELYIPPDVIWLVLRYCAKMLFR